MDWNIRSLRPSGFTPVFGRAVAPSARRLLAELKLRPSVFLVYVDGGCGRDESNDDGKDNGNRNSNGHSRIPCGDDNKKGKCKDNAG